MPEKSRLHGQGFTMIELMVTLSVMAILISLAAPSFQSLIASNLLTSQINELVSDFARARNEAGASSMKVGVCIAASASTCATSGADWAAGHIIWADANSNGTRDAGERIIKYSSPFTGGISLIASGIPTTYRISFLPYGGLAGGTPVGIFKQCAPNQTQGRQLTLSVTGRTQVQRIFTCP